MMDYLILLLQIYIAIGILWALIVFLSVRSENVDVRIRVNGIPVKGLLRIVSGALLWGAIIMAWPYSFYGAMQRK